MPKAFSQKSNGLISSTIIACAWHLNSRNDGIEEDIDANIGSGEMEVSGQYLVTVTHLVGNDYETAGTTFVFDAEEEQLTTSSLLER